jgi:hypothetical protein
MKKYLSMCALIALIDVHFASPCSQPELTAAPVKILILKEEQPELAHFIDGAIEQSLEKLYRQNGCYTMNEMTRFHGYDACLACYERACLNTLSKYWAEKVKEQAREGTKHISW